MPGRNWQRACYNHGLLCGGSGEEGRDRSRKPCDTERIRGRPRRDPATLKRTENRKSARPGIGKDELGEGS